MSSGHRPVPNRTKDLEFSLAEPGATGLALALPLLWGTLTPIEIAHAMSALPSTILGLDDRGRVEPGARADLVVVDPTTSDLVDEATAVSRSWANPAKGARTHARVVATVAAGRVAFQGERMKAWLVLADGTAFSGTGFGAQASADGEVVFNTSMTGYPELLTDPSYRRQILTLTYPEIGNYGVCRRDAESERVQPAALVVRALSPVVSNWRSDVDLSTYLRDAGVPGIAGIDTRALVRRLRDGGTVMGVMSTEANADVRALRERAAALPGMAGC